MPNAGEYQTRARIKAATAMLVSWQLFALSLL